MIVEDVLGSLADLFSRTVVVPIATEPLFASGFRSGFLLASVLGLVFTFFRSIYKRIKRFFQPTKVIAYKDGPSVYESSKGCFYLIVLFLVASVTFLLYFWFGNVRP